MEQKKWEIVVPAVIMLALLVTGIGLLAKVLHTQQYYVSSIATAKQTAQEADMSQAEQLQEQLEALLAETEQLRRTVATLEDENAQLESTFAQLQQQYDALAQHEDTVYYQGILESLQEGLKRVEEYIAAAQ